VAAAIADIGAVDLPIVGGDIGLRCDRPPPR
jgi:hypothetical protein